MQQDTTPDQPGRFKLFELLRQSNRALQTIEKISRADARGLDDKVVQSLQDSAEHSLQRAQQPGPRPRVTPARFGRMIAALRPAN